MDACVCIISAEKPASTQVFMVVVRFVCLHASCIPLRCVGCGSTGEPHSVCYLNARANHVSTFVRMSVCLSVQPFHDRLAATVTNCLSGEQVRSYTSREDAHKFYANLSSPSESPALHAQITLTFVYPHRIALFSFALHHIVLHRIASHRTAQHCLYVSLIARPSVRPPTLSSLQPCARRLYQIITRLKISEINPFNHITHPSTHPLAKM